MFGPFYGQKETPNKRVFSRRVGVVGYWFGKWVMARGYRGCHAVQVLKK